MLGTTTHLYAFGKTLDMFIWNSQRLQDESSVGSEIMISQAALDKGQGAQVIVCLLE